jgi:hypothetical protein
MHKEQAVWFRHAFKRAESMKTEQEPNCDYLEIKTNLQGTEAFLAFCKDGEIIAQAPITNADIKRIKGDFKFLAQLRSRSAHRVHGSY